VVNATPLRDDVLVELGPGQTLVDLPYPPGRFAAAARDAGANVIDGLDVLAAQGALSFERWTGLPAPIEIMRAAIRS
jgi:shikimate dehydrogenase